MLPNIKRQFVVGCLLLSLIAVSAFFLLDRYLDKPLRLKTPYEFVVSSGSNLTRVVNQLADDNVLRYPKVFLGYARAVTQTEIKAGEYRLEPGATPVSLLSKLTLGEVVFFQVTFPEGLTVRQWMERLNEQPKIDGQFSSKGEMGLPFIEGNPEGWLYPDSYRYQSGERAQLLLSRAYEKMKLVLEREWENRAENLPYKTPYDALIMASIIEKETGVAHERQKIAGVFVRRLQKRMRLQTDPTVIYGIGESFDGNLTRRHLRESTPYNTYVIKGLPPTPIANPGGEAIYAALHPAEGSALYFVAKGDGSHHFSATLAEHEEAVQRYQRNRKKSYHSSPKS